MESQIPCKYSIKNRPSKENYVNTKLPLCISWIQHTWQLRASIRLSDLSTSLTSHSFLHSKSTILTAGKELHDHHKQYPILAWEEFNWQGFTDRDLIMFFISESSIHCSNESIITVQKHLSTNIDTYQNYRCRNSMIASLHANHENRVFPNSILFLYLLMIRIEYFLVHLTSLA